MRNSRILAILAASGMMWGAAQAQQPDNPTPTPIPTNKATRALQPEPSSPAASGPTLTVEFPGGTVREFVDAVREAAGKAKVNVIMPKEAETVQLPALSLREVNAYTALQALEYASGPESGNQFAITRLSKGDEASATFAVRYMNASRSTGPSPSPFAGPPPKQETQVFSLRDLVEPPAGLESDPNMATSTDTVLNALKTASQLDVQAKVPPPELMLHKDSMLLLVRGTSEQHRTIQAVLNQLSGAMDRRRAQAMQQTQHAKAAQLEQVELRAQMDFHTAQENQTRMEVDKATSNVERVKKMVEASQASSVDLENAQSMLNTARTIHEQAMIARRALDERAAIINARVQAGGASVGSSEAEVLVIYDYADLKPFIDDIDGLCRAVASLGRLRSEVRVEGRGNNTILVRATPSEHKVIVRALNAIRRAKANEPKLPGLDAEDLIRKGDGK